MRRPDAPIGFSLTHTKLFISIITEFCPVAWISPCRALQLIAREENEDDLNR